MPRSPEPPNDFASLWPLDPAVDYLNHGSFGACPAAVLEEQSRLRLEMEREPCDFLSVALPGRLNLAREAVARFVGAEPANLAFVTNATAGVNAVLRSLSFEPGDEILATTHTYGACLKSLAFVAAQTGARIVTASVGFPTTGDDEIVEAILDCVTPRTRLALLDHITSPTALIMPIKRLVRELKERGIEVLVDGAHAPGQIPLSLDDLGAAYYTGNAHKWLCAPKGAAFLYVRSDRQAPLHPTVISHGYGGGFHAEFDWAGTSDPTPWLCIPRAIEFLGGLLPGGWSELIERNHAMALEARDLVLDVVQSPPPCPDSMIGSMTSIPLPEPTPGSIAAGLGREDLVAWFRARGVQTWLHHDPLPVLRVSAQAYNRVAQFEQLAELLRLAYYGD